MTGGAYDVASTYRELALDLGTVSKGVTTHRLELASIFALGLVLLLSLFLFIIISLFLLLLFVTATATTATVSPAMCVFRTRGKYIL